MTKTTKFFHTRVVISAQPNDIQCEFLSATAPTADFVDRLLDFLGMGPSTSVVTCTQTVKARTLTLARYAIHQDEEEKYQKIRPKKK